MPWNSAVRPVGAMGAAPMGAAPQPPQGMPGLSPMSGPMSLGGQPMPPGQMPVQPGQQVGGMAQQQMMQQMMMQRQMQQRQFMTGFIGAGRGMPPGGMNPNP